MRWRVVKENDVDNDINDYDDGEIYDLDLEVLNTCMEEGESDKCGDDEERAVV